jgi:SnoaL-like polyketide cyclase
MSSAAMTGVSRRRHGTHGPRRPLTPAPRAELQYRQLRADRPARCPEALNHDASLPAQVRDLRGPDGPKRIAPMYRTAFPDVRMTVDDVIASGDKVVLRWHSEGTHRGELVGLAPWSRPPARGGTRERGGSLSLGAPLGSQSVLRPRIGLESGNTCSTFDPIRDRSTCLCCRLKSRPGLSS